MAFDWELRKKEILVLYLREGYTLERIRQKLEDKYRDFNPSISSYRTKLRQWKAWKHHHRRNQDQAGATGNQAAQDLSVPNTPLPNLPATPAAKIESPEARQEEYNDHQDVLRHDAHTSRHSGRQLQVDASRLMESPVVPDLSTGTTPQSQHGHGEQYAVNTGLLQSSPYTPTAMYPDPSSQGSMIVERGHDGPDSNTTMASSSSTGNNLLDLSNLNEGPGGFMAEWTAAPMANNMMTYGSGGLDFGTGHEGLNDIQSTSNDLLNAGTSSSGASMAPLPEFNYSSEWNKFLLATDTTLFQPPPKTCTCPCQGTCGYRPSA